MKALLLLCCLPALIGGMMPRQLTVSTHRIEVVATANEATVRYVAVARVVALGTGYRARIAYVGGKRIARGESMGLPALVAANPRSLVMNGGFYGADPATPAGLLLVGRSVVSPFSFATYPDGRARLSAILCADGAGKLTISTTASWKARAGSVTKACASALQAHPLIVEKGTNGIGRDELTKPRYVRSVLGLRRDGSAFAVFFTTPIHLFAAAEFLRAAPVPGTVFRLGGKGAGGAGLGLSDAINLDGDSSSVGVVRLQWIAGDQYRQLASAIVID